MQYPIIDLITDAYLNNGWTGLELTYGKNLAYIEYLQMVPSINTGEFVSYNLGMSSNRISVNSGSYTLNIDDSFENITNVYMFLYGSNNNLIRYQTLNTFPYTNNFIDVSNIVIRIDLSDTVNTENIKKIQFEKGTEATPYEPYSPPTSDIAHRLKLPLPHYFPHPVLDALQRAAAGTQSADDTEILRHYLTPLGIGGI